MITVHCPCGLTLRCGLGPPSVTCECGRAHRLPTAGAPAAAPVAPSAPVPPAAAGTGSRAPAIERNPFASRQRTAAHDGPAPEGSSTGWSPFANPAVAGVLSVGVLLAAFLAAVLLRSRAQARAAEMKGAGSGTECTFVNAGVSFIAPAGWTLTRKDGMIFSFDAPRGTVSVRIVPADPQTHEETVKSAGGGEWKPSPSEIESACLEAQWPDGGRTRHGTSWWIDRDSHRLWILATGDAAFRADMRPLLTSLRVEPLRPPPGSPETAPPEALR